MLLFSIPPSLLQDAPDESSSLLPTQPLQLQLGTVRQGFVDPATLVIHHCQHAHFLF